MELADKIDPAEVLAHLKQLGYRNISPLQLKEFIRDLKKLIVYDHLSSSSGSLTSLSTSVTSDSECYSASVSSKQSRLTTTACAKTVSHSCKRIDEVEGKNPSEARCKPSLKVSNSSIHTTSSLRRSSTSSSSLSEKTTQKENVSLGRGRTRTMSEDDFHEAVKPKTSFIRPWQLQGSQAGPGRTGRSDPVALYHYYQNLWARRKCPGEDSHSDLRWVIREKMLGQDPHLYSQNIFNGGKKTNKLRM